LTKLRRFGHKTLIFSQFTSCLDVIGAYLGWKGIKYARIDGSTRGEERTRQMHAFARPEEKLEIFLLSARAGGLGVNLQAADTVILFDLDWNPQNDKQAIARSHRFGQQNEVRVFRLLTDSPVERLMEKRAQEKLDLEKKIISAGMFTKSAGQAQSVDMLRQALGLDGDNKPELEAKLPKRGGMEALAMSTEEITSTEEFNRLLARGDEELQAFSEMDKETFSAADRGGDESVASFLQRCGRLMADADVPQGFAIALEEEEDDAAS